MVFRASVAKIANGLSSSKFNLGATRSLLLWERTDLCGVAIVTFQYSPEFALATNKPFGLWDKIYVEHSVFSADSAMGALLVVVLQPHAKDVVELSATEANEVIQYFSLRGSNVAFTESVRHRGAWRNVEGPKSCLFQERM